MGTYTFYSGFLRLHTLDSLPTRPIPDYHKHETPTGGDSNAVKDANSPSVGNFGCVGPVNSGH